MKTRVTLDQNALDDELLEVFLPSMYNNLENKEMNKIHFYLFHGND